MLRNNKSFQFLIGCLVLVAAYKMFTLGVFDFLIRDDSEGFE
jgi:hypothetical protein